MAEESSVSKGFGMACGCALFLLTVVVFGIVSCTGVFTTTMGSVSQPPKKERPAATPSWLSRKSAEIDARVAKRMALIKAVESTGWLKGEELLELPTLDGLTTGADRLEVVERFGEPSLTGMSDDNPVMEAVCPRAAYEAYSDGPATFFFVDGKVKVVVVGLGPTR